MNHEHLTPKEKEAVSLVCELFFLNCCNQQARERFGLPDPHSLPTPRIPETPPPKRAKAHRQTPNCKPPSKNKKRSHDSPVGLAR